MQKASNGLDKLNFILHSISLHRHTIAHKKSLLGGKTSRPSRVEVPHPCGTME